MTEEFGSTAHGKDQVVIIACVIRSNDAFGVPCGEDVTEACVQNMPAIHKAKAKKTSCLIGAQAFAGMFFQFSHARR